MRTDKKVGRLGAAIAMAATLTGGALAGVFVRGCGGQSAGGFANDNLADNLSPIFWLYYAASTMLCCAHAISEGSTHALGAQAGQNGSPTSSTPPASPISAAPRNTVQPRPRSKVVISHV